MGSSSHSDSDSDGEPNSHGARVFWGDLKTPEKSRSNFIDPPRTVVKSNNRRHSRTSALFRQDDTFGEGGEGVFREDDGADKPAEVQAEKNAMDMDLEPKYIPLDAEVLDRPRMDSDIQSLKVPSTQKLLMAVQAQLSEVGSESEVEDAAVLQQPSSSIHILTDDSERTEAHTLRDSQTSAYLKSPSPISTPAYALQASQTPNLTSFSPVLIPNTDPPAHPPLGPNAATHRPAPSLSCAAIGDIPPIATREFSAVPSPNSDHRQSAGTQPPMSILNPRQPEPSLIGDRAMIDWSPPPSGGPSTLTDQLSQKAPPADSIESFLRKPMAQTDGNIQDRIESAVIIVDKTMNTPAAQISGDAREHTPTVMGDALPHTPSGQTRKRSPRKTWKGKEKVDGGSGSSGESSSNTSNESNDGSSHSDEMADKALKKERRAKARREADLRRPFLMSLSPTSVDVLNLLASPKRGRPSPLSTSVAVLELAPETDSTDTLLRSKSPPIARAGPSTPARRVPITIPSPRRDGGPPLRLYRPHPVHLDDPNRTPAQRVPLSATTPQTWRSPLPLGDPDRIPACRVALTLPSSAKQIACIQPGPAVETTSSPPKESPVKSSPLKAVEKLKGNDLASPAPSRVTGPFPLPTRQPLSDKKAVADSSSLSSLPVATDSPSKPLPSSSLRQQSSISAGRAQVANNPYSLVQSMQFKLPRPASRIPILGAGSGPTTGSASRRRLKAPFAVRPTRIPSPVKRCAAPIDVCEPVPAVPVASDTTDDPLGTSTYQRKRQRTITEDADSDEPPAKRPMILIHKVKKGMFDKPITTNFSAGGSSTSQEARSVRSPQPPDPLLVRPGFGGVSGHFETSRSPSRGLVKNTEEGTHMDIDPPVPPVAGPSTLQRDDSPLVDTDTASTVTTLSREPTLDDMTPSSSSVIGPESSFTSLDYPGPGLRRTTRVRKPSSATAVRKNPLPRIRPMAMGGSSLSKASKASTRTMQIPGIPMNQRQLQALTQANTMRNQNYLSDLHRQVVRKEGPRPPSPTTKIKTIMEKAREASTKGREARAERRRRRGEGSGASTNSEGDSSDFKDASSSPPRAPMSASPDRHATGPGDEEDYETPKREPKPSRLDPSKNSKNVKWDRGLARSLSDFAAEQAEKEVRAAIKKGCLARDPKTLRLDPLGNVPDANIPLDDLGRERVIITRFVYDDDDIETTRSRKKKS